MIVKNNSIVKQSSEEGKKLCHFAPIAHYPHFCLLQYNVNRKEIQAQKQKRKNFFEKRGDVEKNEQNSLKPLDFLKKIIYILNKITMR
ncbi:MAG: hypothetical protein GTO45_38985 [Candidatus Aminicenantes bacterium]|nr:hypothetical protein [Candidatus Aminicenantes bacterium]NIM84610.1 hypothetical protein [Candidatus Aminicenantes bacterium]NIN24132.1 hypothetical protein [Candidatus Aminicenantes bacterium]NIN47838.1 hypothetical protein [Candidatus Aminicenantes bacterium]NIN90776.1 hypothetical protein [Candidatus Aminicenantes bacterium]